MPQKDKARFVIWSAVPRFFSPGTFQRLKERSEFITWLLEWIEGAKTGSLEEQLEYLRSKYEAMKQEWEGQTESDSKRIKNNEEMIRELEKTITKFENQKGSVVQSLSAPSHAFRLGMRVSPKSERHMYCEDPSYVPILKDLVHHLAKLLDDRTVRRTAKSVRKDILENFMDQKEVKAELRPHLHTASQYLWEELRRHVENEVGPAHMSYQTVFKYVQVYSSIVQVLFAAAAVTKFFRVEWHTVGCAFFEYSCMQEHGKLCWVGSQVPVRGLWFHC